MKMLAYFATFAMLLGLSVAPHASAQNNMKVRVAYGSVGFSYISLYLAEDKGFMKEEGIDLIPTTVSGAAIAMTGTGSGNFDITNTIPMTANIAIAQSLPLISVAITMAQYPSNVVISKDVAEHYGLTENSSEEQRLSALKGLKLGTGPPNSSPDLLMRFIAERQGWNPDKDMVLLPLAPETVLPAFEQKRIDGIVLSSPTSDLAVSKFNAFPLLNLSKGQYSPLSGFPGGSLIVNVNWLKANRPVAIAVMRALWRATDFLQDHPEEAKAALRARFGALDEATFQSGFTTYRLLTPKTPEITKQAMQRTLDFVHEALPESATMDVSKTFTDEVFNEAKASLHK